MSLIIFSWNVISDYYFLRICIFKLEGKVFSQQIQKFNLNHWSTMCIMYADIKEPWDRIQNSMIKTITVNIH